MKLTSREIDVRLWGRLGAWLTATTLAATGCGAAAGASGAAATDVTAGPTATDGPAFVALFAEALCSGQGSCAPLESKETCKSTWMANKGQPLLAALKAGTVKYDSSHASACLSSLKDCVTEAKTECDLVFPAPVTGCAASSDCAHSGRCTNSDGTCIVASDADCVQSWACKTEGRCRLKDGACAALADADCQSSEQCKHYGRCTLNPNNNTCHPATDADCAQAAKCKYGGLCHVGPATCKESDASSCNKAGLVGSMSFGDECVPMTDDECRLSEMCSWKGICVSSHDGACMVPLGVAKSDADCQGTADCKISGACKFINGNCMAGSAADCQQAERCKLAGQCSLGKACLAITDADCAQSVACKADGLCKVHYSECVTQ